MLPFRDTHYKTVFKICTVRQRLKDGMSFKNFWCALTAGMFAIKSFAFLFAIPRFYGQICVKFEMQGMSASLENSLNSTGNRNIGSVLILSICTHYKTVFKICIVRRRLKVDNEMSFKNFWCTLTAGMFAIKSFAFRFCYTYALWTNMC